MSRRRRGSVRLRLTTVYSLVVFGLAALVAVVLFGALRSDPTVRPVTERVLADSGVEDGGRFVPIDGSTVTPEQLRAFEGAVKQRVVDYLRPVVAITLVALFLVSLAVGWLLAGRILRPVRQITAAARRIGADDLDERLDLVGPDDELRRLGDTFDSMLERLHATFENQRRFVADASHELRNPLAITAAGIDLALRDPDAERARDALHAGRRAAARMTTIVDDLLVLTRAELPPETVGPLLVDDVARDVVHDLAAVAAERGVTLELAETTSPDTTVLGDRTALHRVVTNLVDNALHACAPGGRVNLSVSAATGETAPDPGPTAGADPTRRRRRVPKGVSAASGAQVAVSDNGCGVPAEHLSRVFDRFWRGPDSAGRGGNGLGLAIARQVAQSHGGHITAVSQVGVGSRFTLWLPTVPAGPRDVLATTGDPASRGLGASSALGRGVRHGRGEDGADVAGE